MKILILFCTILSISSARSSTYKHPGTGSFFEIGRLLSKSVHGNELYTSYAVPKFDYGRFSIEGLTLNYNVFDGDIVKFGPVGTYNFQPYSSSDIEILANMERKAYFDLGVISKISIPFGELSLSYVTAHHENQGEKLKVSFATALPLLALNGTHVWLNIQLEHASISAPTANYLFGVDAAEATPSRLQYQSEELELSTTILGLWTPINSDWWINLTYIVDRYETKIKESPIVSNRVDSVLMLGLMYSFGDLNK